MKRRPGSTNRVLDGTRFTVSLGSSYVADGSHRRPILRVIDRKGPINCTLPLPHVQFYTCYRLRRVGGLRAYKLWHTMMRKLCINPDIKRSRRCGE